MNTKQQNAWEDLVQQCEAQITERPYSSINVASQVRSDAIVAAGELVELVTPDLPALLERLGSWNVARLTVPVDRRAARELAARIREALALEASNES